MSWLLNALWGGESVEESVPTENLTADEIRARRLRRFQNEISDERSASEVEVKSDDEDDGRVVATTKKADESRSAEENVLRKDPHAQPSATKKKDVKERCCESPKTPVKVASNRSASPEERSRRARLRKEMSAARNIHATLSRILEVHLVGENGGDEKTRSSYAGKYVDIALCATEEKIQLLNASNASEVVFARLRKGAAAGDSNRALISHLCECWCRAAFEKVGKTKAKDDDAKFVRTMECVQEVLMNYSVTIVLEPEITGSSVPSGGALDIFGALSRSTSSSTSNTYTYVPKYLNTLFAALHARGAFEDAARKMFAHVVQDARAAYAKRMKTIQEQRQRALLGMMNGTSGDSMTNSGIVDGSSIAAGVPGYCHTFMDLLNSSKRMAEAVALQDDFLPSAAESATHIGPHSGLHMEQHTFLGIVLSVSMLDDPWIAREHFSNLQRRTLAQVMRSTSMLQEQQAALQTEVHNAVKRICQSSARARRRCLLWVTRALQFNCGRTKSMQGSTTTRVASDSFALNLFGVLVQLCQPFADARSKAARKNIDARLMLCRDGSRASAATLFPADEERVTSSSTRDSSASEDGSMPKDFHFVTQVFFLALRALHLGPAQLLRRHAQILQQLGHVQRVMRQTGSGPNVQAAKRQHGVLLTRKVLLDACVLSPAQITATLRLMGLSASWLLHVALGGSPTSLRAFDEGGDDATTSRIDVVLPKTPPELWAAVPQHIVEDLVEMLMFIGRERAEFLEAAGASTMNEIVNFVVLILASPQYIRSPHLRAKFGDLLFFAFLESNVHGTNGFRRERRRSAFCARLISDHPVAVRRLAPALMCLYGDVEHTGFYEKMQHRYRIAKILKHLWDLKSHRPAFVALCSDPRGFEVFANGLMNHTTDLFTTALDKLPQIRAAQIKIRAGVSLDAEDESERDGDGGGLRAHQENERLVTGSLQLANETLSLLCLMTSNDAIAKEFTRSRLLCGALAAMLLELLRQLTGPKCVELKVENMEAYNFRPKVMLAEVARIFVHLERHDSFIRASASDGRYTNCGGAKFFRRAVKILRTHGLIEKGTVAKFDRFREQLVEIRDAIEMEEEKLGDAPDEFLDALMCTVMRDPVRLPSGNVVDRETIRRHLLNDRTDPFTRAPMDEGMLKSEDALRARIEAWRRGSGA
eukprot:g2016.t1